ncbi:hypothetical protein ROP_48220 [Rhodococcus opacus B4]|uniref:Uncharacterized protein n=1 Tax=Rhodococcus opacus (strain B4) TaxID=632772 RepID=C1BBL6_RHOOB|nr:hypothetical protein ROP_48220 [Rhodococcus opacus B4]
MSANAIRLRDDVDLGDLSVDDRERRGRRRRRMSGRPTAAGGTTGKRTCEEFLAGQDV